MKRDVSPWSRAERGSAVAFVIAAVAVLVLHWLAMALDTLGIDALNWPVLLVDLPSLPLYFYFVCPLQLPEPLPHLSWMFLSALVWGILAAMPTYIVISRVGPIPPPGSI